VALVLFNVTLVNIFVWPPWWWHILLATALGALVLVIIRAQQRIAGIMGQLPPDPPQSSLVDQLTEAIVRGMAKCHTGKPGTSQTQIETPDERVPSNPSRSS
jgi:hypothetical protein